MTLLMEWNEYDYNGNDTSRSWYEHDPVLLDAATATVWALHLHVPDGPEARGEVLKRLSLLPHVTGEFTHGDSWSEWGEPKDGEDDCHMVIYYRAAPHRAWEIGVEIANRTGLDMDPTKFAVSTAGDYAEQVTE